MSILQSSFILFLIIDSVGGIAIVASLLKHLPTRQKILVVARECFFALCTLAIFATVGSSILSFLGLSHAAVMISSFFILGLIGLGMIFPHISPFKPDSSSIDISNSGDNTQGSTIVAGIYQSPLFSPIAMPLLVGSSSIAYVSTLSATLGALGALSVVCISMLGTVFILIVGTACLCNQTLLTILERLAGMVLVMLAIQSLLSGITLYLQ